MKTQQTTVTYDSGTVTFGRPACQFALTVHTGAVRVTVAQKHAWSLARRVTFAPVGPFYVTATVEAPNGTMEALTDTRVSASPFTLGWR